MYSHPEVVDESAKNISAMQSFIKEKETLMFSFVRHPFTRLVSAYTDKFLGLATEGGANGGAWKVIQES